MAAPQTIPVIVGALMQLVMGFKPADNLENDLANAVLVIDTAKTLGVKSPIISAARRIVDGTEAGAANLKSGQAAVVGSHPEMFDGSEDEVVCVLVRKHGPAGKALGLSDG